LTARTDRVNETYDGLGESSNERSRYSIARRDAKGAGDADLLVVRPLEGRKGLPAFGFEEARMFLDLRASGRWQVRKMTKVELTSVLVGSCAGVARVVLDPLPGPFGETVMDLASVGRRAFMEPYLRNGGTSPFLTGPGRRRGGMGVRRATFEKG
jgi:hypothetical protein